MNNTLFTPTYTVTPEPLAQCLALTPKRRDVRHLLELTASALGRPTTRDRDATAHVLPAPGIPWDTFWTKLIHDRRTPDEELGRLFHQLDLAGAAWIKRGAKHNWQGTVGPFERYEEWRGWYLTASQVMEGQGRCYTAVDPETTWAETQRELQHMAEESASWSEDDYEPTAEERFISTHLAPDIAGALYDARRNAVRARYFVGKMGGESGDAATLAYCAEQLCAQAFRTAKARNPTGARFFADSAASLGQAAVVFTLSETVKGGPPTPPLSATPSLSKQQQRKLRRKGQKSETRANNSTSLPNQFHSAASPNTTSRPIPEVLGALQSLLSSTKRSSRGDSTIGTGKSNSRLSSSGGTNTALSSPHTNAVATIRASPSREPQLAFKSSLTQRLDHGLRPIAEVLKNGVSVASLLAKVSVSGEHAKRSSLEATVALTDLGLCACCLEVPEPPERYFSALGSVASSSALDHEGPVQKGGGRGVDAEGKGRGGGKCGTVGGKGGTGGVGAVGKSAAVSHDY